MRYFIEFSYFGKAYHGWQIQPNAITVQQVLEKAFSTLIGDKIALVAAGRTDAGVHAKQMFAHFDCEGLENIEDLVFRLNSFLPDDISVKSIFEVSKTAHARFNAVERTYEYWLVQKKNPFYIEHAHYVNRSLDVVKMNKASQLIMSYSDFECFSKSKTEVHTFLCDINKAEWQLVDDRLIFTITANRFLRNMVRATVGTLLEVGIGKWSIEDVKTILESKDRTKAGVSVPAKGLYLSAIKYPQEIINS
ncbi:tRNA pseudouridine(38-40) synthase TruA [Kriegella sp. EG-1]|nr:tRNA pseudouridine(38-40) synthase TruA [Flavobacteriaceae bacterium EG-1]